MLQSLGEVPLEVDFSTDGAWLKEAMESLMNWGRGVLWLSDLLLESAARWIDI